MVSQGNIPSEFTGAMLLTLLNRKGFKALIEEIAGR